MDPLSSMIYTSKSSRVTPFSSFIILDFKLKHPDGNLYFLGFIPGLPETIFFSLGAAQAYLF